MRTLTCLAFATTLTACAGAPPLEKPNVSTHPSVVAVPTTPPPPTATALVEPPLVRAVIGSSFEVDADEPLPKGAVARCGTTRMLATNPSASIVSDDGKIWAIDTVGGRTVLRDLTRGRDVVDLPSAHFVSFAPDATFVALHVEGEAGQFAFISVPAGTVLGQVKVPLKKIPRKFFKRTYFASASVERTMMAPDGKVLAVVTSDETLHLIDTLQYKLLKSLKIPAKNYLSAISNSAKFLLFDTYQDNASHYSERAGYMLIDSTSGATVRKETYKSPPTPPGEKTKPPPEHQQAEHKLATDGTKIYRAEADQIVAIDPKTGHEKLIFSQSQPQDASSRSFFFRSDRPTLTIHSGGKYAIFGRVLIDLTEPATRRTIDAGFQAMSLSSKWIVSRDREQFHISPDEVEKRPSMDGPVTRLTFLANNQLAAFAQTATFWDTTSCKQASTQAEKAKWVAAARDKLVTLVGTEPPQLFDRNMKAQQLDDLKGTIGVAAFSSSGESFFYSVSSDYGRNSTLIEERLSGASREKVAERAFQIRVTSVDVSPLGTEMAVATGNGYPSDPGVLLLVSTSGFTTIVENPGFKGGTVAFAGPSRLVHHGGMRRPISVLTAPSLVETMRIHMRECCDMMAVSPDGKLVVGATERDFFVWDVATRKLVGERRNAHRDSIGAVAFSADGQILATGARDTTVLFWDVQKLTVSPPVQKVSTAVRGSVEAKRFVESDGPALFEISPQGALVPPKGPLKVVTPPLKKVTKVASLFTSHCAIADSKVRCWGSTRAGILGIPEERIGVKRTVSERTTPTTVAVTDPIDIQMTGRYACALEKAGDLICWGRLGYATGDQNPTKMLSDVKIFDLTGDDPCAVDTHGAAYCWTAENTVPKAVGSTDATAIATGREHLCILNRTGTVYCRGKNQYDQLGDGTGLERPDLMPVKGVVSATAIRAARYSTCALLSGGNVSCWGLMGDVHLPSATPIPALDGATALRLDDEKVCGLLGDRVDCVRLVDVVN